MIIKNIIKCSRILDNTYDFEIETEEFGIIPITVDTELHEDLDHINYLKKWIIDNSSNIIDNRPSSDELLSNEYEKLLVEKKQEVMNRFNSEISILLQGYPTMEINSWDKQEAEARAFIQDSTVNTPLLYGIAVERGLSVSELANRVITKADQYTETYSKALGKKQYNLDLIKNVESSTNSVQNKINTLNLLNFK